MLTIEGVIPGKNYSLFKSEKKEDKIFCAEIFCQIMKIIGFTGYTGRSNYKVEDEMLRFDFFERILTLEINFKDNLFFMRSKVDLKKNRNVILDNILKKLQEKAVLEVKII
jgi:hypothetical protein